MQLHLNIEGGLGHSASPRSFSVSENVKCTIGRGKSADWCLTDPTRFLSTIHCEVLSLENGFFIVDRSTNGLTIEGQKPPANVATPLKSGSLIEMGPYRIRAMIFESSQSVNLADERTLLDLRRTSALESDQTIISPLVGASLAPKLTTSKTTNKKVQQSSAEIGVTNKRSATQDQGKGYRAASFVDAFSIGASIGPDLLAGRTDIELAQEMGRTMQKVAHGLFTLTKSVNELREMIGSNQSEDYGISTHSRQNSPQSILQFLLAIDQPGHGRSDEILGDMVADLIANDQAMFGAMQAALFRLLNQLSPISIEAKSQRSFLKSKKSAQWDAYVALWEQLSTQGENGMLDVYLSHFKEVYDNKMDGG